MNTCHVDNAALKYVFFLREPIRACYDSCKDEVFKHLSSQRCWAQVCLTVCCIVTDHSKGDWLPNPKSAEHDSRTESNSFLLIQTAAVGLDGDTVSSQQHCEHDAQ